MIRKAHLGDSETSTGIAEPPRQAFARGKLCLRRTAPKGVYAWSHLDSGSNLAQAERPRDKYRPNVSILNLDLRDKRRLPLACLRPFLQTKFIGGAASIFEKI